MDDTTLIQAPTPTQMVPTAPMLRRSVADLVGEVILRGKSAKSKVAYRSDLEHFFVWLLGTDVSVPLELADVRDADAPARRALDAAIVSLQHVTEADMHRYRDYCLDTAQLAPTSWNRRLTPINQLFLRLQRYNLVRINPVEDVRREKLAKQSTTVYLSRTQARALIDSCEGTSLRDVRDRAIITFMIQTGLRSSELIELCREHISTLDGHMIASVKSKGLTNNRDIIKITPTAWTAVRNWLERAQITSGPIFRRLAARGPRKLAIGEVRAYRALSGLSYQGLYFILTERFIAAGLEKELAEKLSPHSLRHSFVTLALRGGASVTQAQAAARHADPRTTMGYAHDMNNLDDNAVDYVKI